MIDIINAEKAFDEYVSKFDKESGRIKLKIEHIKRVANLSKTIAKKLNLNEEQVNLAMVIGYFHDIGRFRQAQIFDTFSDKDSINHAELSVKVLFEENLINEFKIEEKYYNIIKKAVLNHNKAQIEDGLNEDELLYAKIIRDADKLDIFQIICEYDFESIFWYKDFNIDKISQNILKGFYEDKVINYSDIKNNADQILAFYVYIYNFYYDFSLEYLREKGYLDIFTKRVIQNFCSQEVHKQVKQVLKTANDYLSKYKKD